MSKTFALPLLSLAATIALAPAEVAAQGFDLQPAPTPSSSSSPVYGPQDPDRPPVRPIPVPTQSATPAARTTPTPLPSATVTPIPPPERPELQPLPTARPTAGARSQRSPTRSPTAEQRAPAIAPSAQPSADASIEPPAMLPGTPAPSTTAAPTASDGDLPEEGGLPWLWIALGALAVLLAGAFALWKRRAGVSAVSVPEIERPTPIRRATPARGPGPGPAPTPAPTATIADPAKVAPIAAPATPPAIAFDSGPLHVAFEVRDITLTMMAVTLNYRITLSNRGDVALGKVLVGGSMEAASGDVAVERQLAPPQGQLPIAHQLETLDAGAVAELTGEIRLPLTQLQPIRQGDRVLLVPIARLRAAGTPAGADPVIAQQSVLLGRVGQGPQFHPIQLDQGPRVYRDIGQRIVTPKAA